MSRWAPTALLVLFVALPAWSQDPSGSAGTIDLEAANRIVDSYVRHFVSTLDPAWRAQEERRLRDRPPHIDAGGVFQLMGPAGALAFEYDAEGRRLHCDALIFKPREEFPRIGLSREEITIALERAVAAGVDTGGGKVFYDPVAQGFFLRRTYADAPDNLRTLHSELDRLTAAGEGWFRQHYLEAVLRFADTMRPPATATGRDGDFQVTIVLTPDKRYQDLWRGPRTLQPQLVSRSAFVHGQEVWALALFSGAPVDADNQVRLQAQYTFVYPDGSVHGSPVGNLWWSDAPPADRLQMAEFRAAIELGADTPPGDYVARIQACEPALQRCVVAETPFHVVAASAP